jgi:hypothetical protein
MSAVQSVMSLRDISEQQDFQGLQVDLRAISIIAIPFDSDMQSLCAVSHLNF